jgi:hypothetical protein
MISQLTGDRRDWLEDDKNSDSFDEYFDDDSKDKDTTQPACSGDMEKRERSMPLVPSAVDADMLSAIQKYVLAGVGVCAGVLVLLLIRIRGAF